MEVSNPSFNVRHKFALKWLVPVLMVLGLSTLLLIIPAQARDSGPLPTQPEDLLHPRFPMDVTFVLVADPQFTAENDHTVADTQRVVSNINAITNHTWPPNCLLPNGDPSPCGGGGQPIGTPQGVVVLGDLTMERSYTGSDLCCWVYPWSACGNYPEHCMFTTFRTFFEYPRTEGYREHFEENGVEKDLAEVNYPVYVGLGNHDFWNAWDVDCYFGLPPLCSPPWCPPRCWILNWDCPESNLPYCRKSLWNYMKARYDPDEGGAVSVSSFDDASGAYSWQWGNLYLVQAHEYIGETSHSLTEGKSSLHWLTQRLDKDVGAQRPVIIFQHYNDNKWPTQVSTELAGHNVIAVFHGDEHFGEFQEGSPPQFAVGRPGCEGNNNQPGQFAVVHVTGDYMTVAWAAVDDQGQMTLNPGAPMEPRTIFFNQAPTVGVGKDATINEGGLFIRSGSFTDPNPDTWSAAVDYGDGSGSQSLTLNSDKTFTLSHTYADDGTYTVTVTVTDHHGAAGADTATVTVNNVAPTVSAGGDQTVDEGDIVTLDPATFNDPGTLDTHTATVEWGDGTSIETGVVSENPYGPPGSPAGVDGEVSGRHVYADDGIYTVEVCVMDDDGATTCDTLNVAVENVAPVSNIDTLTDERDNVIGVDVPVALVGLDVYLAGSFNDAGTRDTHTANISWGDETPIGEGVVTETPFGPPGSTEGMDGDVVGSRSHAYQNPQDYTITLSVIDDDGGVGTATAPIRVADPVEATEEVIEDLISLAEDDPNVAAALDKLRGEDGGQAANGALDMLEKGNLNAGLEKIKQALQELEAAEAADPTLDLSYIKDLLALTAKSTAVDAIGQAEAEATKPNQLGKIQQAKDLVAQGDTLLEVSDYVGAVDKYQRAVREVQGIH